MVATWTADTISGSGLRLVISQLVAVSNIAIPTADRDVMIRMTVNATLPNTPQREGVGPFGAMADGLVKGFDRDSCGAASCGFR